MFYEENQEDFVRRRDWHDDGCRIGSDGLRTGKLSTHCRLQVTIE
jgi:hypothetical protein